VPSWSDSVGACGSFTYTFSSNAAFASFDSLSNTIDIFTDDKDNVGTY
jgi:hypothetical protein